MRYADIRDNVIVQIVGRDPVTLFAPSIAELFVELPATAPDDIGPGWRLIDDKWEAPAHQSEPIDAPDPQPITANIPVPHFKMRMTPQERVAIKEAAKTNPYVADWLELLDDPRLEYVTIGDQNLAAAMGMLVTAGIISQDRLPVILAAQ